MANFGDVYERILEQYNAMDVPQCIHCESTDTSSVGVRSDSADNVAVSDL